MHPHLLSPRAGARIGILMTGPSIGDMGWNKNGTWFARTKSFSFAQHLDDVFIFVCGDRFWFGKIL